MYSSHDVNSDTPQPISPPETIPPDVPPHVNQSCRHHSVSRPANVSSNSATTGTGIRLLPPRLSGILDGKIPLFCRALRLASENQAATVTSSASAQPSRTPSSPILDTTPHGRGSQVSPSFDLMPPLVVLVLTSSLRYRLPQVQTMPKTLLSAPYPRLSYPIYSLSELEESNNRPWRVQVPHTILPFLPYLQGYYLVAHCKRLVAILPCDPR